MSGFLVGGSLTRTLAARFRGSAAAGASPGGSGGKRGAVTKLDAARTVSTIGVAAAAKTEASIGRTGAATTLAMARAASSCWL